MSNVPQVQHFSIFSSPWVGLISLAMAVSRNGSLPDPAADIWAHFVALPRRPHTVEDTTYMGGLLVGEGWSGQRVCAPLRPLSILT